MPLGTTFIKELDALAAKHDVQLIRQFSAGRVIAKFIDENEKENEFRNYARNFGADPAWFGKTFKNRDGEKLQIIGLLRNRRKNCISLLRLSDNRERICAPDYVRQFKFID
jgi:hypothetical protein